MKHKKRLLRNKYFWLICSVLCIIVFILMIMIHKTKSVSIGFVADLSGKKSELGVQTRNGVQLAIEKVNANGGINGHEIRLIIKDDKGTKENATIADQELIDDKVVAIIGHTTSAQTLYGMEVTEKNKVLMIGTTVSTPLLSGKDDNFIRVYPSFDKSARSYADYIYGEAGKKSMVIIYDIDNEAYSKTYSDIFSKEYIDQGGSVLDIIPYASGETKSFTTIIQKCMEYKPEGCLIIASDVDTAFIAQRARVLGWDVQFFTSAWAQTRTLISSGGEAVDGIITEQAYPIIGGSKSFNSFLTEYKNRFGTEPYFSAAFGYEAAMVIAEALKGTDGKKEDLKEEILKIKDFQGINDSFSFDRFGDVERPFYMSKVKNQEFVVLKKLTR